MTSLSRLPTASYRGESSYSLPEPQTSEYASLSGSKSAGALGTVARTRSAPQRKNEATAEEATGTSQTSTVAFQRADAGVEAQRDREARDRSKATLLGSDAEEDKEEDVMHKIRKRISKAKRKSEVRFRLPERRPTSADIQEYSGIVKRLLAQVEATQKDNSSLREKLKELKEEMEILIDISKTFEGDLDSVEASLLVVQDEMQKQQVVVEQLLRTVTGSKGLQEDGLSLRLAYLEKDQTKVFRFQLLVMLSLAVLTFWCYWRAQLAEQHFRRPDV